MALPILKEGVRFECQQTGARCTSRGEYGFIYLTKTDQRQLAEHLGLTVEAMAAQYCDTSDGHVHLKNPELDCKFLEDKRCTIYPARPEQCRMWPFWPENMQARVWKADVAAFCAGIGKGRLYTPEEIQDILDGQQG